MHPFDLHPEFYNKPILLSEEELANPMLVIQQFFDDYHSIEVRMHLSNMQEVCISTITAYKLRLEREMPLYAFTNI